MSAGRDDRDGDVEARHGVARLLIRNEVGALERRFGTAWASRRGQLLRNATHSGVDVLREARELAGAVGLAPETLPLVELAAVFHAHHGTCGDGSIRADEQLRRWPQAFDAGDRAVVRAAIEGLLPLSDDDVGPLPRQRTVAELGTGLTAAAFGADGEADLVRAIVADADRVWALRPAGLHRLLLAFVERERATLAVPAGSDGRDVAPDRRAVADWLLDAGAALLRGRWVLAATGLLLQPLLEERVERLRRAAVRFGAGEVAWRDLVTEAPRL